MHMSYGVLASKGGVSLLVESTRGTGGVQSDAAIDRFQTVWGATWVAGRLTLTKLHLTYMPNRVGKGAAMLKIDLRDVTGVELSGGRVSKVIGIRPPSHVLRVRTLGAAGLAQQIAELAEEAKAARRV